MECVAYMRVSTERQAEEGNGLDSQKRDILAYAGKNEFIIKEWYIDDGYTGANMNRPALQRLINDCYKKKIETIIAFKLDRISRGMVDGLYIIEKVFIPNGVTLKCVHDSVNYDSPMEQAYTQMMAVFAQLDKNTMLLRMRGGMLERVKQGHWPGGGNLPYCYGYSEETGTLIPVKERVEKARRAMELYLAGWSDAKICEILGFSCEKTVVNLLTSIVNTGMIPYKGSVYQGLHEPVFSQEEFDMLQRLRSQRKRKRYTQNQQHLLTGLCYCGICGCSMRYQKWGNKGYRIYCQSRNKDKNYLPNHNPECSNVLFVAADIEREVEKKILDISLTLDMKDHDKAPAKVEILKNQLESVKTKLKRLYGIYADGNDSVVDVIGEMEKESRKLKEEIIALESAEKATEREQQYEQIKKIADIWGDVSKEDKNKILKSIIDKILLVNGNIEIYLKEFSH